MSLDHQADERRSTRYIPGERRPKVTREKIAELVADGIPWELIAERLGRSISTLKDIHRGRKRTPGSAGGGPARAPLIPPSQAAAVLRRLERESTHQVARALGVSQSGLSAWAQRQRAKGQP